MSDTDLKEKESAALDNIAQDFSPEESSAFGQLADNDDIVGRGFSNDKPKGRFWTRKRTVTGAIVGLTIGGGISIFSILQGPLQIVHFGQLLRQFHFARLEDFGDGRTTRILRNLYKNRPQNSRLSRLGNKVADRYERRMHDKVGLRSVYDAGTGKFLGFEIIDDTKAKDSLREMQAEGLTPQDSPPPRSRPVDYDGRPVTGRMIDLSDAKNRKLRSVIRTTVGGTGSSKVSGAWGSRLLIGRAGVNFHPLENARKKSNERLVDFYRERKEKRAQEDRRGTQTPDSRLGDPEDPDGDGEGEPTNDSKDGTNNGNGAVDDAQGEGSLSERKSKVKGRMTGVAGFVGVMCMVKQIGNQSEAIKHSNIILPLIRIGTRITTTGFQVMSGNDVNLEELGSVADDLYDKENQTSWAAARSIQAELGEPQTGPDMPSEAKPGNVGNKPAFFQFVDSIPGIGTACSSLGQGILAVVDITGTVTDTFKDVALNALGIPNPEDVLAEKVAKVLAGEEINSYAKGAELGNYANYGARLAANDVSIAGGGRPLAGSEVAELDAATKQNLRDDFRSQSLLAQVFNITNVNSVVSQVSIEAPKTPAQFANMLFKAPSTFFGTFFAPAYADGHYDYGFKEYGFSLGEQNDDKYDDPLASGVYQRVEQNLDELNEKYEKCFSMKVTIDKQDPEALPRLVSGQAARYDEIEKDENCTSNSEELKEYRFYLADAVATHTLACFEGEEDSCLQLNGTSSSTSSSADGLGVNSDGFTFPLRTNKNAVINNEASRWCYRSQTSCHHDYPAADIFVPTGTIVVAAVGGTVVSAKDNDGSSTGSRVTIKGDDGNLYYYTHMGDGTITVNKDDRVQAGQELGRVGTRADAMGTDMHLHFDILPSGYDSRPGCSGSGCKRYPFINPQPALISAFEKLP